jgi:mono/diheme cytochrome c family protein
MALGAVLGLAAMVACGGGENQQAAADEMAMPPAAETAMEGQHEMEMPEGVTMEMVTQGREIYSGAGLCYTCHGANGEGVPGLGANFTDGDWTHSDGSYEGIAASVLNGVDTSASSTGTPMPPKGGSGITDDQARAVSAYVWTIAQ